MTNLLPFWTARLSLRTWREERGPYRCTDLAEAPHKDDGILGISFEDSEDDNFNPGDPDKDESVKTESSSSDFTSDSEDFSLIFATDMLRGDDQGVFSSVDNIMPNSASQDEKAKVGKGKRNLLKNELSYLMQSVSPLVSTKRNAERCSEGEIQLARLAKRRMAIFYKSLLLLLLSLTDLFASTLSHGIGINYGQIANNLPTPSRVSYLLRSLNVMRVKLYDTDPNVLTQAWIEQHVQPYHTQTKITCITVGNEVLTGTDMQLKSYLLPAMQGVYKALVNLGLDREIFVAHPHSAGILGNSFPPSSGSFRQVSYNSPAEQQVSYSAGTYDSYRENARHCHRHSSP
ncbi:hypothetical protein BC332_29508 [Capsicum chinense]|nr:hypothetical protein BC332_29508 [Capsicum chinense]